MEFDVPSCVHDFLGKYSGFVIVSHSEPDGDSVGSMLALRYFLARLGKTAAAFSSGPFTRHEILPYRSELSDDPFATTLNTDTGLIIVDCQDLARCGLPEQQGQGYPQLVVDHHSPAEVPPENAFVDPTSPSTTLLIYRIMKAWGMTASPTEAFWLVFGFCTDTGFFRHLPKDAPYHLAVVSELLESGVSLQNIYQKIYTGKSWGQVRLLGKLLAGTEVFSGGQILLCCQELQDTEEAGQVSKGSDDLFRQLLAVDRVEAAVLIKQESPEQCSVGLRSAGRLDVSAIARTLGGGGHRLAAGFTAASDIGSLRVKLLKILIQALKQL